MKLLFSLVNYSLFAVFAVVALVLFYFSAPYFGNKALVVRSGSMKPTIGVGDLVVVNARESFAVPRSIAIPKYKVGEVIAFSSGEKTKTLVTHRIVSTKVIDNKVFYETKGDANKILDKSLVSEQNIIGSGTYVLPKIGKLVAFTKSNIGFPMLVVLPAFLVVILEFSSMFREIKRQRSFVKTQFSQPASAFTLKAFILIIAGFLVISPTFAFFSDGETSSDNIFTAADSFGPPIAQTLVVNEFLWNSSCTPNPETKFWIELFNGSPSQINLKDWRFRDADGTVIQISNANAFINSGAYVLITKSNATFSSSCYTNQGGVNVLNLGGNPDFTPAATGGVIRLESPNGSGGFDVIDRVEYGPTFNSGALNAGTDQSISRSPNGVDSALGDIFAVSDFEVDATISPGVAN